MNSLLHPFERRTVTNWRHLRRIRQSLTVFFFLTVLPTMASAQIGGSPFDTGFTALQNLFA